MFNSIRLRLSLVVLLLFVPILLLVLWIEETHQGQLIQNAQHDAAALTASLAAEYRQYVESGHQLLTTLAQLPIIRNKNVSACNTLLASLKERYGIYNGIFVVDASTNLGFCSAIPYTEPVDNSRFEWYQEVLRTQDFVVSKYRLGSVTGKPVVTLGYPVMDDSGQIISVVGASLSLAWLNTFIETRTLPPDTSLTILDESGAVLVRYPERLDWVGKPFPVEETRAAVLANPQGVLQSPGIDGTPRIYAYALVAPEFGNIHILVGIPEKVALASVERVRSQSVGALIIIILVGIVGAWISSGVMIRPINDLKRAIGRLAAGELSSRTELRTETVELQQLLLAFNEMAAAVESRMAAQVEELTVINAERAKLLASEREAREEAEALADDLTRLQAVTEALGQAIRVEDVAQITVERTFALLNAETGNFQLFHEEDQTFEILYSVSRLSEKDFDQWKRYPADPAFPATDVVRRRQSLWFTTSAELADRYPALAPIFERNPGAGALIPVVVRNKALGVVSLNFGEQRTIEPGEKAFIESIVQQCAQALERVRLAEQAEAAAALRERQRLARDLHDAVSQTLFSATMIAESIPRIWQNNPDPARVLPLLEQVYTLNKAAGAEMRVLLWELRPEALEKAPLKELLTQLANTAGGRKKLKVTLDLRDQEAEPLPLPVHIGLYRIAQEALNNVVKHAAASEITILLIDTPQAVEVCITDNGRGFEAQDSSAGLGMGTMRERAEGIGAVLAVTSQPGQGTQVRVRWSRSPKPEISS